LLLEVNFYQTKLIAKDRELNNCREKLAQQNAEVVIDIDNCIVLISAANFAQRNS
jgi:hypothetical protein